MMNICSLFRWQLFYLVIFYFDLLRMSHNSTLIISINNMTRCCLKVLRTNDCHNCTSSYGCVFWQRLLASGIYSYWPYSSSMLARCRMRTFTRQPRRRSEELWGEGATGQQQSSSCSQGCLKGRELLTPDIKRSMRLPSRWTGGIRRRESGGRCHCNADEELKTPAKGYSG